MKRLRPSEVKELASERLKVIKPLCEEALGRRINGDITIRVHTRLVSSVLADVWYPVKKACTAPFEDHWGAELFVRSLDIAFAPVFFTIRGIFSLVNSNFRVKSGYAITGENVILILPRSVDILRADIFDYFLAHELTHLLTEDVEKLPKIFGRTIYEGLATYYGEMIARVLHPGFNVLDTENRPHYISGYQIMRAIAETQRDPLHTLIQLPPDSFDELAVCLERLFAKI